MQSNNKKDVKAQLAIQIFLYCTKWLEKLLAVIFAVSSKRFQNGHYHALLTLICGLRTLNDAR